MLQRHACVLRLDTSSFGVTVPCSCGSDWPHPCAPLSLFLGCARRCVLAGPARPAVTATTSSRPSAAAASWPPTTFRRQPVTMLCVTYLGPPPTRQLRDLHFSRAPRCADRARRCCETSDLTVSYRRAPRCADRARRCCETSDLTVSYRSHRGWWLLNQTLWRLAACTAAGRDGSTHRSPGTGADM